MEHENQFGAFQPEKWGYLFSCLPLPGIFLWDESKNRFPFSSQPKFPDFFQMESAGCLFLFQGHLYSAC